MWEVQPTMVRGWPAAKGKAMPAPKPHIRKGQQKRKDQDEKDLDADVQELLPTKKRKSQKEEEIPVASEMNAHDFRKSEKGRKAIVTVMRDLCELDQKKFIKQPLFDEQGRCRLNSDGARKLTRDQIIDSSGACFEALPPSKHTNCFKYHHVPSKELYGKQVEKILLGIRDQLDREEPRRSSFLRLVKDIADYVNAVPAPAPPSSSEKK
eukprot:s314_g12.t1